MALKYFNVKNGLTTGNISLHAANSNVQASTFLGNISGTTATFIGNVSLGNVSNVHINGGNSGYILRTDGAANLTWVDPTSTQSPAPMPITIDTGNTLTITANYQGLFAYPLTVNGTLDIDGILIDVSGQGPAGTTGQIQYNGNADFGASNGFTFDASSGNMAVPGSVNISGFAKLAAYTSTVLRTITGVIGQIAVVSNSNPGGMMAYWDTTNNRWSYVFDNSAV